MFDEFPVSTIKLPKRRSQKFIDIFLAVKHNKKLHCPQIKSFIRGASPGVSHELCKKAIGGRGEDGIVLLRKGKLVKTNTLIVKGSAKLSVRPDQ